MDFWKNVKTSSEKYNINQKEISEKIGVNFRTYQNWVYRNVEPSIDVVIKMSKLLNVSIDFLFTGKENEVNKKYKETLDIVEKLVKEVDRLKEYEDKYNNLVEQIKNIKI